MVEKRSGSQDERSNGDYRSRCRGILISHGVGQMSYHHFIATISLGSIAGNKARKWITGEPMVVIENGQILEHNMKKDKQWLFAELSNRGLSLKDVFYGVKGSDGYLFLDKYKDDPMV